MGALKPNWSAPPLVGAASEYAASVMGLNPTLLPSSEYRFYLILSL
jgi:hypothetical protein